MERFELLSNEQLENIINKIGNIHVALIGDLCLDVYWFADMTKSELSRETPHFPLPVVDERMSPGAGANVAANIAALRPANIKVLGAVGEDWRSDVLLKAMQNLGINTDSIVRSKEIITNAYCKPIRKGISPVEYEDPRIDFANYKDLPKAIEVELLRQLEKIIDQIDVLCISDQLNFGCITPAIREKIISFGQSGKMVVVDSRDRIREFRSVTLKPNEIEGYRAVYGTTIPDDRSKNKDADNCTYNVINNCDDEAKGITKKMIPDSYVNAAKILAKENQVHVCMTLGPNGCLYTDGVQFVHVPCHEVQPPIDFCGAGDTFLSSFSCAMATGVKPWEAAAFANMAAEVTIKKIGITGTASPEEIRKRHEEIICKK